MVLACFHTRRPMSNWNIDTRESVDQWWESFRNDLTDTENITVRVLLSSPAAGMGQHSKVSHTLETLESAKEAGLIETYTISIHGGEICLCEQCRALRRDSDSVKLVTQLRKWRSGGIRPSGFVEREVDCSVVDDSFKVLNPPDTVVAIYKEQQPIGVFPCEIHGTYFGTSDLVDFLWELSEQDESELDADDKRETVLKTD